VVEPDGADHRGEHDRGFFAFDREDVGGVAAFTGVQDVEGTVGDLGEHGQLDGGVGFDDRGEAVLPVDEGSGGVERDALVGDLPVAAAHRGGELADGAGGQRPVGGVAFQVFGGLAWCHGVDFASHNKFPFNP
jgi:hypothetical protein